MVEKSVSFKKIGNFRETILLNNTFSTLTNPGFGGTKPGLSNVSSSWDCSFALLRMGFCKPQWLF